MQQPPLPKTVLVTGATGFLGFRLAELLLEKGVRVIATGRTLKPELTLTHPDIVYKLGSLENESFVQSLFAAEKPDAIVHCASLSSPWGKKEWFHASNVLSQQYLIRAAQQHGIKRYVYISSPSIYFDFSDRFDVTEETPLPASFVNDYARTKFEAEQLLHQTELDYIILRPRAMIGRGDIVIMPRLIRAYKEGRLRIIGSGTNIADLTPVANVADAIACALVAGDHALKTAYNITNGTPVNLWDSIAGMLTTLGLEPPAKKISAGTAYKIAGTMEWFYRNFMPGKEPALTRYSVGTLAASFTMNITRAKEKLQYAPRVSVAEGMQEFADWYKNKNA